MHWANAAATLVMMSSGWQIYNASPILRFAFPAWSTLGGWLGGGLLWHFAAMWLLALNGSAYLLYGLVTRRLRQKLWPVAWRELRSDLRDAARLRLGHEDLAVYNTVQKLAYLAAIVLLIVAVLSGIALWKPVQFDALSTLMGGFQGSRSVHFAAMAAIFAFLVLHVAMSLLVPRSLLAMIRGR